MKKYLVGSRLLKLANFDSDYDYVSVDRDRGSSWEDLTENSHVIHVSPEYLNEQLSFKHIPLRKSQSTIESASVFLHTDSIVAYQYDKGIIGQDFPYQWSLLEHKSEALQCLQKYVDLFSYTLNSSIQPSKRWYHVLYMGYLLLNNSLELTKQQLETVHRTHDRIINGSELSKIIKSLISQLNQI